MKAEQSKISKQYTVSEKLTCIIDKYTNWTDCLKEFATSDVVQYCVDGIRFFMLNQPAEVSNWNLDSLLKMRIFDEHKELLLWKNGDQKYAFRFRKDEEQNGKLEYCFDSIQLMKGYTKKVGDQFMLIDDSGTRFEIHQEWIEEKPEGCQMWVQSRNYLGFNQQGQSGIVDSRLIKFFIK